MRGCNIESCIATETASYLWEGKQFCPEHYRELFIKELEKLWGMWDGQDQPDERLRYLIGRYYNDYGKGSDGSHWLTQAIVRDRSKDWKKTASGAEFTVTRYPVEKKDFFQTFGRTMYQTWFFNFSTKEFSFLREEKGSLVQLL